MTQSSEISRTVEFVYWKRYCGFHSIKLHSKTPFKIQIVSPPGMSDMQFFFYPKKQQQKPPFTYMERSPWTESDAAELAVSKKNKNNKVTKATTMFSSSKKKKYKIDKKREKTDFVVARIDTKRYKFFFFRQIFFLAKILLKSSHNNSRVKFISNVLKIITKHQFTALDS